MILGLLQNDLQMGVILIITLIFSLSFHDLLTGVSSGHSFLNSVRGNSSKLSFMPLDSILPVMTSIELSPQQHLKNRPQKQFINSLIRTI